MSHVCEDCRGVRDVRMTDVQHARTLLVIRRAWICEACREAYREEEFDVQVMASWRIPFRPRRATWGG